MRIIIKIGTSTLTYASGCINIRRIENLCKVISDLKNAGNEVIMVSSGAIAMGHGKLNIKEPPQNVAEKQAFAAVGQCELMYAYDKIFSAYNITVAQILLTADDLRNSERHEKFDNTMAQLLKWNVLPVINENDTVSTTEIKIGDNDTLAYEAWRLRGQCPRHRRNVHQTESGKNCDGKRLRHDYYERRFP